MKYYFNPGSLNNCYEKKEVFYTLDFVCIYFYWFENKICQKKSDFFSQNIFVKIRFRLL